MRLNGSYKRINRIKGVQGKGLLGEDGCGTMRYIGS